MDSTWLIHHKSIFLFLIELEKNIYTLELFHGPTLAFKDVGARFMANCLGHFNKDNSKLNTVLVATSGDTGALEMTP